MSHNETIAKQRDRLHKAEHALDVMAEHCRTLCQHLRTATPKTKRPKSGDPELWPLLEKDTALSQKILGLIGAWLTQEKRLAALMPRETQGIEIEEESIDWPMLEDYFHRRTGDAPADPES